VTKRKAIATPQRPQANVGLRDFEAVAYALGIIEGMGDAGACRAAIVRGPLFTLLDRMRMALEDQYNPERLS
jgi:hypothetical protein